MKHKLTAIILLIIFLMLSPFISCSKQTTSHITLNEQQEEYLDNLIDIKDRFIEKYELAKGTSKIALSPIISQMQDIKNELSNLKLRDNNDQLIYLSNVIEEAMDSIITVFLEFQREDRIDQLKIEFAENCFNGTEKIIEGIKNPDSSTSQIETMKVRYIVTGPTDYIIKEIIFSDPNGNFNKAVDIKLTKNVSEVREGLSDADQVEDNEKIKGEIIAEFDDFPQYGFIYLETDNNFDEENPIGLFIYVNGNLNSFEGSTLTPDKKIAITRSTIFDDRS